MSGYTSRSSWQLPALRNRPPLAVWASDDRLGTFVAGHPNAPPMAEDIYKLRLLDQEDEQAEQQQSGSEVSSCVPTDVETMARLCAVVTSLGLTACVAAAARCPESCVSACMQSSTRRCCWLWGPCLHITQCSSRKISPSIRLQHVSIGLPLVQGSGMNMVLKAGSLSVLLRDALRRPLLELELGALEASLRSMPKGVTQVRSLAFALLCSLSHHLAAFGRDAAYL